VGTGSGAIAISIARHAPACRLTAVDVSAAALQIARENAATHQVAERIEFLESDLLAAIGAGQRFDVVVSNPPYVSRAEWEQLVVDIRKHEPPLALVGGETGVETIARLVPQAAAYLVPGGWLLLEISPMIEAAVRQVVEQGGAFTAVETCKDLAGLPRLVKARRAAG
jgi:release factor glutamine methyltransferase